MKTLQPYEKMLDSFQNLKDELLRGNWEHTLIATKINSCLYSEYPHKTKKEPTMQNYMMINGEKIDIPDTEIERLKKTFMKDSPEYKCKELNDMVTKYYPEHDIKLDFISLKADYIKIGFPGGNTNWSKAIMKSVLDFCDKYPKYKILIHTDNSICLTKF